MQDFYAIPNTTGTFPDVAAQNASGPGVTDGTAITKQFVDEIFGFFQALLSDYGVSPSGSAEVHDSSQLLDAVKNTWRKSIAGGWAIPGTALLSVDPASSNWYRGSSYMSSQANGGQCKVPLLLNPTWETVDTIYAYVYAGDGSRTGDDRLRVRFVSHNLITGAITEIAEGAQAASSGSQTITLSSIGHSVIGNGYSIEVIAGTDGTHVADRVYGLYVEGTRRAPFGTNP